MKRRDANPALVEPLANLLRQRPTERPRHRLQPRADRVKLNVEQAVALDHVQDLTELGTNKRFSDDADPHVRFMKRRRPWAGGQVLGLISGANQDEQGGSSSVWPCRDRSGEDACGPSFLMLDHCETPAPAAELGSSLR